MSPRETELGSNRVRVATANTVDGVLHRSARRVPDNLALKFGDREWTYSQLNEAVTRVARHLRDLGIAPGDRVAAYGKNSDAFLLLFLGCARAGCIHVPINFNASGQELLRMLSHVGCMALFADPALQANVDDIVADCPSMMHCGTLHSGDHNDVLDWANDDGPVDDEGLGAQDEDLVQLLYTSGTTAAPKAAMITHRALLAQYASGILGWDIKESDRTLHSLPLYHVAQMHTFLMPSLAVGAMNVLMPGPTVGPLLETCAEERINTIFLPPTVWIRVADEPDLAKSMAHMTKAYYGASIMPVPVIEKLREKLPSVGFYNGFGQTEMTPASILRPEEQDARPDSIGRAVLFVELDVIEIEGDERAGEGEVVGELVYRSPQLCEGYWGMPKETEEAFTDGWFHSGDLVRRDAEGYLFIIDRIKEVINTGGVLVAPREVEEALYTHPAVAEVAVIGLPHERWLEAVTAVVVLNGEATEDELTAHVSDRLAGFKVPKTVYFVDELPKNASGKVLKRELRSRYSGSESAVHAPSGGEA